MTDASTLPPLGEHPSVAKIREALSVDGLRMTEDSTDSTRSSSVRFRAKGPKDTDSFIVVVSRRADSRGLMVVITDPMERRDSREFKRFYGLEGLVMKRLNSLDYTPEQEQEAFRSHLGGLIERTVSIANQPAPGI